MDDRIRTSDADRERITAMLRDHFAEGRLTPDELDERLTAALNAKTFGDLRRVMVDLPGSGPDLRSASGSGSGFIPPLTRQVQPRTARFPARIHHGPRILPLVALTLLVALLVPGARWVLLGAVQVLLVLGLTASLAAIVLLARFRRHLRREWGSGRSHYWRQDWRGAGCAHHRY